MDKGEGNEDIILILNNFNFKMSKIADHVKQPVRVSKPQQVHSQDEGDKGGSYVSPTVTQEAEKIPEPATNEKVDGAAVAIPLEAVEAISSRFFNTLYGYFIGMESVLENGPWLIRSEPLMLNILSHNTDLKKVEVKHAPVWVKLHHVPIVAHSEIELSLITTQIGKPIMLDSYTSNMCLNSWGRSTYAKALIEVSAEVELKDKLIIAIPVGKDKGETSKQNLNGNNSDTTYKESTPSTLNTKNISVSNSFTALNDEDAQCATVENTTINDSDSEDVDEELVMEDRNKSTMKSDTEGASTPNATIVNV
nr:hypothetical protein [Tanacetum cinerariifolium]